MAKRQRGGARPGQRAPLPKSSRPATPPPGKPTAPAKPAGSLSDDELARAAELEARIVAEEQAASASVARGGARRRQGAGAPASRARGSAALTATAEEEYRYVMADLRKIVAVFALVFGLLLASWLLIVVTGIVAV